MQRWIRRAAIVFFALLGGCQEGEKEPGSGIDYDVFGSALLKDFQENDWKTLRGRWSSGGGEGRWGYQSGVKNGEFLCVYHEADVDSEKLTKLVFYRNAPVDPLYLETDALVERLTKEFPNLSKLADVVDVHDVIEIHQGKLEAR
jgi:hypothetical protein